MHVQSTLGFPIIDIAANLDLATARGLTDIPQYINSDLVFIDLKFWPLFSDIATIKVVKPWSQYHEEIDLNYQPPLGLSTLSPVT